MGQLQTYGINKRNRLNSSNSFTNKNVMKSNISNMRNNSNVDFLIFHLIIKHN